MSNNNFNLESLDKTNPFRVPEGYFQKLNADVMSKLPETAPTPATTATKAQSAKKRSLRLWYSVAASVCIAVFGASAFFIATNQDEGAMASTDNSLTQEEFYASDYIMLDNETLYSYLSEN